MKQSLIESRLSRRASILAELLPQARQPDKPNQEQKEDSQAVLFKRWCRTCSLPSSATESTKMATFLWSRLLEAVDSQRGWRARSGQFCAPESS